MADASRSGRYAPSPTGELHLGNLRTALLAWLFARSAGAPFAMRIEDLDVGRVRERFVGSQLDDLRALGIDWDGEPIRQSGRAGAYAAALGRLAEKGRVFRCFCTRREVREAASAQHGGLPEGFYPGTCLELSEEESNRRAESGDPFALRLRSGREGVAISDRLRGTCEGEVDDLVLMRRDGGFAYNLAVVVDDGEQQIGEVVRGDDLLPSTPGQALLCDLLELPRPEWAHVPLILGADGARLAKRHGDVTLADLAAAGHDVAEVLGFMAASLGMAAPGERVSAAAGLLERFDPGALPREPLVYSGF